MNNFDGRQVNYIEGAKAVTFAGVTGEMSKVKDRLKDWETKEKRDWYRLRALLVSADGSTWYHATAMVSEPELAEIETDFERLLGSIRLKLEGNTANEARAAAEAETAVVLEKLKDNMECQSAWNVPRRNTGFLNVIKKGGALYLVNPLGFSGHEEAERRGIVVSTAQAGALQWCTIWLRRVVCSMTARSEW